MRRLHIVFALIFGVALTGCTHHQLRYNTANHAKTVADVHTQQVLDNLARFVANPCALPHFEIPNQGASGVTDTVNGNGGAQFNPFGLTGWSTGLGGMRASNESFTMTPINDPRKLELMRCAYQRAVAACCLGGESMGCPNCDDRFNKFYLGTETPGKTGQVTEDGRAVFLWAKELTKDDKPIRDEFGNPIGVVVVANRNHLDEVYYSDPETGAIVIQPGDVAALQKYLFRLYVDNSVAEETNRTGKTTAACLGGACWFEVGKKGLVPRDCLTCGFVGKYCNTYVWVPESGRDQLTLLTLTILDIAINDPPAARTKEVVAYLDVNEQLTTKDLASYRVTALIPMAAKPSEVAPNAKPKTKEAESLDIRLSLVKAKVEQAHEELDKATAALEEVRNSRTDEIRNLDATSKLQNLSIDDFAVIITELETDDLEPNLKELVTKAHAQVNARKNLAALIDRQAELAIQRNQLTPAPDLSTQSLDFLPPQPSFDPANGASTLQLEQRLRTLAE